MAINGEEAWQQRARTLTKGLVISGALNIGLLSSLVYFVAHDRESLVPFEAAPPNATGVLLPGTSNGELLASYAALPFADLVLLLEDEEMVEAGYRKRDLALAVLTAFHSVALERALGAPPPQRRTLSFIHREGQEKVDLPIFPGLSGEHYRAILQFLRTERWPFTAQGLFFELTHAERPDPALVETFCRTTEYQTLEVLFRHAGHPLPKEVLVPLLVAHGDWRRLETFVAEQKAQGDVSSARLATFLLETVRAKSPLAARLLIEWERPFLVQKVSDADLLLLLDLVTEKLPAVDLLLKELVTSSRSDAVWKKSGEKLYAFAGETLPEPYHHLATLKRFYPEVFGKVAAEPKPEARSPEKRGKRTYIVQEGDSLWKIARRHKVSVDAIIELNHLSSEKIAPGKELEIP
jgi:hypothetical protein